MAQFPAFAEIGGHGEGEHFLHFAVSGEEVDREEEFISVWQGQSDKDRHRILLSSLLGVSVEGEGREYSEPMGNADQVMQGEEQVIIVCWQV